MSQFEYNTCAELKAAGYPQGESCTVWVECEDGGRCTIAGQVYDQDNGSPLELLCACPNSDELIAAIQARWPKYDLSLHDFRYPEDRQGRWGARARSALWGRGDTPAAALAALYIALAKGDTDGK